LTKALEAKSWDPSVKALTQFSDVLQLMSDELEWTQKLGDAFLAQEDDVFARIQFLRQKADEAGNLKSNKRQKVTKKERTSPGSGSSESLAQQQYYYEIEPVDPDVVYVPVYEPAVAYGTWWYPDYEPYYWDWYPGSALASGFFWGAGFVIARNLWDWNDFDWNRGNIDIDVDRFNNINVNRPKITNAKWEHNPRNRGPVPYRDKASREKFGKTSNLKDARKDFRGFDKDKGFDKDRGNVDRVKDKLGGEGASKVKDKLGDGGASKIKDKVGEVGAGSKIKDKAGDRGGQKVKDKAASRDKPKAAARDAKKGSSKRPSSKGASKSFDVKPKAQVNKHVNRGNMSRKSAASHRGGGGRSIGGGGGGVRSFSGGGRRGGGGGRGGGRRSDSRLKESIVPLVRLDNGLALYRFRYKGNDHTDYVGVMAQEVQKLEPGAVWADGSGYLMVDYDRIGLTFMTWSQWVARGRDASSARRTSVPESRY
jgi:uncharacterized membrane protein YgcG